MIKKKTASTTASRKAKGRRLQQHVATKVLELHPELDPRDVVSTPMGMNGNDLTLSPLAEKVFPYDVECKNTESLNVWKSFEQLEKHNYNNLTPLLVYKRNRSDVMVSMKLDDFFEILKNNKQ